MGSARRGFWRDFTRDNTPHHLQPTYIWRPSVRARGRARVSRGHCGRPPSSIGRCLWWLGMQAIRRSHHDDKSSQRLKRPSFSRTSARLKIRGDTVFNHSRPSFALCGFGLAGTSHTAHGQLAQRQASRRVSSAALSRHSTTSRSS